MSDREQAECGGDVRGSVAQLASPVLSNRDYALYIEQMSAELAEIADRGGLPTMIGYALRMASLACHDAAKGRSVEPRPDKAPG